MSLVNRLQLSVGLMCQPVIVAGAGNCIVFCTENGRVVVAGLRVFGKAHLEI